MAISPSTDCDVVVIGAGCAGLAAAVRLAPHCRVVVVEGARRLGGRATAFQDPRSAQRLDNGQHALFGCYRETYQFLNTLGTAHLAPLEPSLSLVMADATGRASRLSCPPWPAPWHLVAGLLSWSALPLGERLAVRRLAGFWWSVRRDGPERAAAQVAPHMTVSQWLHHMGQPASLCDWLWYPLALAALNQSPDVAAAQPFARVVGELFGPSPAAAALGIPSVPLDQLYAEPAARLIERHGGEVVRGTQARVALDAHGDRHVVVAGDVHLRPKLVISAVPWHAFGRLWMDGVPTPLADIVAAAGAMVSVPIVTAYLWFDGPVMPAAGDSRPSQVGLVGTRFHWAFAKGHQRHHDGDEHLIAMVASDAASLVRMSNAELAQLAEQELRSCLPSTADASCRRAQVVRESRATFSVAPGGPVRPKTLTPVPGLLLAGDWTDTGLPGTIEGAVQSGHRAADAAMIAL